MKYFAYGSNMSLARLRARTPGAVSLGRHDLPGHELRFHKSSRDGSAKCDAFYTGLEADVIMGVLFEIDPAEKTLLDKAEGLGHGYDEKVVAIVSMDRASLTAHTYVATHIKANLRPYAWYLHHVLVGAREAGLPESYIDTRILSVETMEDPDREREARERAIYD